MKSIEAISRNPIDSNVANNVATTIDASAHIFEVLPKLLDDPQHMASVSQAGATAGIITADSMLEALGRLIAPRYDASIIELECHPSEYSASSIARAVEDTDSHLVDIISTPADNGLIHVTLRVRSLDPSHAVQSLERYGFTVVASHGASDSHATAALERILALQSIINV